MNQIQIDNSQEEQMLINRIVASMNNSYSENAMLIVEIQKKFPQSVILNYYVGMYYQKFDKERAKTFFEKCVNLEPLFTAPYYELAQYYLDKENVELDKDRNHKLQTEKNIGKLVYTDFKKKGRPFFTQAEKLLLSIFNKITIDYTIPQRTRRISFDDNIRIAAFLNPLYMADREFDSVIKIYDVIKQGYKKIPAEEIRKKQNYMIAWKNMHIDLGQIYFHKNMFNEAYETYANGFKYGIGLDKNHDFDLISTGTPNNEKSNYLINKYLLEACMLTRHYMNEWRELPVPVSDIYDLLVKYNYKPSDKGNKLESFGSINETEQSSKFHYAGTNKIYALNLKDTLKRTKKYKIGYISPDFNKNAVGLFLTPLVKHYSSNFEVYVYYTNGSADEYTLMFKQKYRTRWFETNKLDTKSFFELVKSHDLDFLVDLIGHGHGNTLDVVKLFDYEPKDKRPLIYTYLGYPDTTMLKVVDYRIVDDYTDHIKSKDITEKLMKLPRCFLCYHPFDNEEHPTINYYKQRPGYINDGKVRIGILNKSSKHSTTVLNDWKIILEKCPNCILYIKLDQHSEFQKDLYKNLPQDQLHYIPFQNILQGYYDIYNEIDFCIDTYPYSGTTTTCSTLYMGVPMFAKYNRDDGSKRHVSNVSASLLLNAGFPEYVCKNGQEYRTRIIEYINKIAVDPSTDTNESRLKRRNMFLDSMEPVKFMKEFEECLIKTLEDKNNGNNENNQNVVNLS